MSDLVPKEKNSNTPTDCDDDVVKMPYFTLDTPPTPVKTCRYCGYDADGELKPFRCYSLKVSETPKPWVSCGCFKEKK